MRQPYIATHLRTIRVTLDVGVAAAAKRRARRVSRLLSRDSIEHNSGGSSRASARMSVAVERAIVFESDEERAALLQWRSANTGFMLFEPAYE